jgi:HK97 family phage portal protein
MLETRLFNVSEIARFFNINPVLLGDLSKSSYSTIEAANIEFVTHTLMPYIAMIECEFNRKLIAPNEEGFSLDLDETYLIRGDKNSTATYYKTLVEAGIITRNEARRGLGLNELDGLDNIVIPYTNIADNTVSEDKNIDKKEDGKDS